MGGGAWPFLVGGVICLVNAVNERDRCLLNSLDSDFHWLELLRGMQEDSGNNRSVMPLDVLGHTRATLLCLTIFSLAGKPGQSFELAL
jgi:hypothetical protein